MIREPFNEDWRVSTRKSLFEEIPASGVSESVTLPHDVMLSAGRAPEGTDGSHTGYFRSGSWRYEKTFDVPQEWAQRRVTLEFEGAYRDAMVYINGSFAGHCSNGYTMFHVAADPYLVYGAPNTVRVEVQAGNDTRWYSGAGLYRPVSILVGGLVHVTPLGLQVSTPEVDAEVAVAAVATEVHNESVSTRTVQIQLEIRDSDGTVVAADRAPATLLAGERAVIRQRSYVRQPAHWSVDEPNLYTATVRVLDQGEHLDEATTSFGIRTLSLDPDRGLRINGEPVKLRGTCIHHDNGPLGAAEFTAAQMRRVARLKAAGFNAIRSSHNPASVALLEACDRLGMLVMEETFDCWTESKTDDDYSRRFAASWESDLDSMVAKDFNHPSVIFYCIGNEIQEIGTPHGARLGRLLAERIRRQDSTRLITNGINGIMAVLDMLPARMEQARKSGAVVDDGGFNTVVGQFTGLLGSLKTLPEVGQRIEESASVLDVVGLNYAGSRYLADHESHPERIMVGSETFPTEIASLWQMVRENPYVLGDFTWTGWDYMGETGIARPIYPGQDPAFAGPYPWLIAGCGDIDIIGTRRPMSYYREIVFGLREQPYLAVQRPEHHHEALEPHAWRWTDSVASWTWDVDHGAPTTVEAYANADEVAFVLNGEEVARSDVGAKRPFVALAEVPYEPGTLEAVAFRDGVESGRTALHTAGPATLRIKPERETLRADHQDLAFVEIVLADDRGVIHPGRDRQITVSVTGPARLQALGTAQPATEESFLDSTCTTYEGRALAVLRSTGGTGTIEVRVSCDQDPAMTAVISAVDSLSEAE